MDAGRAAHLLALMLGPTAAIGSVVWGPRVAEVARRAWRRYRQDASPVPPVPAVPPIERTARDLRRLLRQHEAMMRASAHPGRAARLTALRGALTDCALDAAVTLEVPAPPRVGRRPLGVPELSRLLADLSDAGLVIPGSERFPGDAA